MPSSGTPSNWPASSAYLTSPHIPLPLPSSIVQVTTSDSLPIISPLPQTPNPLLKIGAISASDHPAYGQHGLFASQTLPPGTFIIFYLGRVHDSNTTNPNSNYDLSLDRDLDLSIDATECGNEARFINDYRGIRPEGPNAEFRDCVIQLKSNLFERRIGVFVLSKGKSGKGSRAQGIKKGEEVVVSYGKGFWKSRTSQGEGFEGTDEMP